MGMGMAQLLVTIAISFVCTSAFDVSDFQVVGTSSSKISQLALKDAGRYLGLLSGGKHPTIQTVHDLFIARPLRCKTPHPFESG